MPVDKFVNSLLDFAEYNKQLSHFETLIANWHEIDPIDWYSPGDENVKLLNNIRKK